MQMWVRGSSPYFFFSFTFPVFQNVSPLNYRGNFRPNSAKHCCWRRRKRTSIKLLAISHHVLLERANCCCPSVTHVNRQRHDLDLDLDLIVTSTCIHRIHETERTKYTVEFTEAVRFVARPRSIITARSYNPLEVAQTNLATFCYLTSNLYL